MHVIVLHTFDHLYPGDKISLPALTILKKGCMNDDRKSTRRKKGNGSDHTVSVCNRIVFCFFCTPLSSSASGSLCYFFFFTSLLGQVKFISPWKPGRDPWISKTVLSGTGSGLFSWHHHTRLALKYSRKYFLTLCKTLTNWLHTFLQSLCGYTLLCV